MRTISFFGATALLLILLTARTADACTCNGDGPPCQAYGNTAAVFVGTAIDMKPGEASPQLPSYGRRVFTFNVEEAFRGVTGIQVQVFTGIGSSDCGYSFQLGERYLVYAGLDEKSKRYVTSTCTRTQPLAQAAQDLAYVRGLGTMEPGATLSGEIQRLRRNLERQETERLGPVSNIEISVTGDGKSFTARTDEQGRYQLTQMPPGKYTIKPSLPAELSYPIQDQTATLIDRGCAEVTFYVTDNTRISGRVIDREGKPVPKIRVDLIPASQAGSANPRAEYAWADDDGRYELKFMAPGKYLVGVRLNGLGSGDSVADAYPRTCFPGVTEAADARIITINEGTVLKDMDLRLPPGFAKRTITGKVVFPDGQPATRASVLINDKAYSALQSLGHAVAVDHQGNFSFAGYEGTSYYIMAYVTDQTGKQWHAEVVEIPARGAPGNLVLVASEPNMMCERCFILLYGKRP